MKPLAAIRTRHCELCGAPAKGTTGRVSCWSCLLLNGQRANAESIGGAISHAIERSYQHYEILRREDGTLWELGRGAMGATYKAIDKNLQAFVALKVINARFSSEPAARRRFLREARAAARLFHPNVAVIFHFGEITDASAEGAKMSGGEGDCFYAMEFIAGETLEARLRRCGVLASEFVVEIGMQVTRALHAAEKIGLVHCDLKPANIMLVGSEETVPVSLNEAWVKVIDFGLAKAVSNANENITGNDPGVEGWAGRTGFVGTPQFASPEQLKGEELDVRSDIFSLGATLWYAITGELPFDGDSLAEIQDQQSEHVLPLAQLTEVNAPACVVELLSSMLAPDRTLRPASAPALQEALRNCLRTMSKHGLPAGAEEDGSSTRNPEALRLFRCAQGAVQGSFEIQSRYEEAIRLLELALARDPGFVLAHARLAEMHALMFRNSYDRSPARAERALTEAQSALDLNPRSSEAHRALGLYEHHVRLDYPRTRGEFTVALETAPDDAENVFCLGLTDCRQSRWEEGLACFQRAAELEPYRLDYVNQWWRTLADMRRYEEARRVLNDLIALRPEDIQLHVNRAYLSYSESADLQPLREVLAQVPADYDPDGYITFLRNGLARYNNDPDEAERILAASPFQQFRGFVDGQVFPRSALEFLNALLRGDMEKTRALAAAGRPGVLAYIEALHHAPGPLLLLASFDAILGRREEALDAGRRGLAMLPVEKDGVDGPKLGVQLAWVYFHLGEFEAGTEILRAYVKYPGAATYGEMKLGDVYRQAQNDPHFQAFLETQHTR